MYPDVSLLYSQQSASNPILYKLHFNISLSCMPVPFVRSVSFSCSTTTHNAPRSSLSVSLCGSQLRHMKGGVTLAAGAEHLETGTWKIRCVHNIIHTVYTDYKFYIHYTCIYNYFKESIIQLYEAVNGAVHYIVQGQKALVTALRTAMNCNALSP